MEKIRSCPKCQGTNIVTEKRIDGDSQCQDCNYKDKTGNFTYDYPTFKQYMKINGKQAKLFEKESTDTKGIYVACKYNQTSTDEILELIRNNNIPSILKAEYLHTTIIYSRKYADFEVNDNMEDSEIVAIPTEFHVFDTFNKKRALVLKLDCDYLAHRHKELMTKYELSYDYDEYIPHVTLSYDIGDLDIKHLKDVKLPKFLRISAEYKEDLNLKKKYT